MRQLLAGLSRRQAGDVAPLGRSSGATGFARGAPPSSVIVILEPWTDDDQACLRIYGLSKMRDAEQISASKGYR